MEISFALEDGDHFTSFRRLVAKRVRAAPPWSRRGQGIGKEGPEAVGVDIVQFDEPTFNVFFDEANDWGMAALERAAEGLKAETSVHICYSYGIKANTDWKKTLGAEWRHYEKAFPNLRKSGIDIVSLECRNSRVPMDLIELIQGKKVMVGAIDVATDAIETPEEVADTLRTALRFVDADKLIPATNCGMAPLSRDMARGKLAALGAGAAIIRKDPAPQGERGVPKRLLSTRQSETNRRERPVRVGKPYVRSRVES